MSCICQNTLLFWTARWFPPSMSSGLWRQHCWCTKAHFFSLLVPTYIWLYWPKQLHKCCHSRWEAMNLFQELLHEQVWTGRNSPCSSLPPRSLTILPSTVMLCRHWIFSCPPGLGTLSSHCSLRRIIPWISVNLFPGLPPSSRGGIQTWELRAFLGVNLSFLSHWISPATHVLSPACILNSSCYCFFWYLLIFILP